MNGMIEKEELIWVCENFHDTMGDFYSLSTTMHRGLSGQLSRLISY